MTDEATGSTVPRRQLGRYLRDLRSSQRLTVRKAAERLEWSEAKLWRIESGLVPMRSLDVEAMCRIYGATPEMTEGLMGLAKETKAKGWWHAYGDVIPDWLDLYIGLEESASSISWYESGLIPGLLQTEGYARTVITADNPGVDDDEISRRVHVRIARQTLLTRVTAAPQLAIVLNEAMLRCPVGGTEVMPAQLARILDASELPNVTLRILPFSVGLHPGLMSGPFVLLNFPVNGDGKPTEPPTVYMDGYTGALYLDRPHEIERYSSAFQVIWHAALNENASRDLLSQAVKELGP